MTSMCEIRDRSVVRSSVIPSAKYCCSGSLLRLAKGNTTIDSRGAIGGGGIANLAGVVAMSAGAGAVFVGGQSNQPVLVIAITATTDATIVEVAICRGCGAGTDTLVAANSATVSGRNS